MIQVINVSGHAPYNSSGAQFKTEVECRQEYMYVFALIGSVQQQSALCAAG